MPYTFMYASGLKAGLTTEDLRTMPYQRLANLLSAFSEAAGGGGAGDTVVEATQAHIDSILG